MSRIEWTATGRESLEAIALFIADQNESVQRALQVVDRIEAKCDLVAKFPESGTLRPDLGEGIRSTLVDSLVIIYRPLKDGIRILLVAEGHQDLPSVLFQLWS
ncbi:MAG: type II toxin-antitoxin system RelE/ParE family toxin [Planctomycetales bacterium]|nr:type II toxin-antitoxin system RelE/ParE family toxin [Planctomycetales bacterium]